ncbi:MAG TPA: hypothetical protein DDW88_02435 [Treponema sp.]|nr:hypothetical protein [Treponema sp.]
MSVNDLRLVLVDGTIVKDGQLEKSERGIVYLPFCIASNKSYKKDGKYEKITDFFDLCLFGTYAEKCSQLLKKGMRVRVECELGTYKDPTSNYKHYTLRAKNIVVVDFPRKKESENDSDIENPEATDFPNLENEFETKAHDEIFKAIMQERAQIW